VEGGCVVSTTGRMGAGQGIGIHLVVSLLSHGPASETPNKVRRVR